MFVTCSAVDIDGGGWWCTVVYSRESDGNLMYNIMDKISTVSEFLMVAIGARTVINF